MEKHFFLLAILSSALTGNNAIKETVRIVENGFENSRQPRTVLREMFSPEDPYYTGESRVYSGGIPAYQNIIYDYIGDIETVWDYYTGKGVTIAIIDTGIDANHSDFSGKISAKSGYFYTIYENEEDFNSPYEVHFSEGIEYISHGKDDSHGSKVAGVAAAETSSIGIVGVAPDAELLILKIDLDDYSANAAIKYAVDCGAKVINMSLGGYAEPYYNHNLNKYFDELDVDYYPEIATNLLEGINYAYDNGVIIVAAAGNECTDTPSYPAANDHVIGVGALGAYRASELANYSNYNNSSNNIHSINSVDVVAPGSVVTTDENNNYVYANGTSFSCPIVSGLAALYLEKYPDALPDEFSEALFESCNDLGITGWDYKYGYGSVNAFNLMITDELDAPIILDNIFIEDKININVGETHQIQYTLSPNNYTPTTISFNSSDKEIVSVDENGLLTAHKKGSVIITITVDNMSVSTIVSVKENVVQNTSKCGGNLVFSSYLLFSASLLAILITLKNKTIKQK